MKNTDYLSWDQYFMGIATLSAKRSKDPHTRVGACIVAPVTAFVRWLQWPATWLFGR